MKWNLVSELPMQPCVHVTYEENDYLVTDGIVVTTSAFARGNGCGTPWAEWSLYGGMNPSSITHWMPLPPPPTKD